LTFFSVIFDDRLLHDLKQPTNLHDVSGDAKWVGATIAAAIQ
jgi:hypothetical protein